MEKHLDIYANNYSDEAIASMRAEMEALAEVVDDEESWPAYIEEQVSAARRVSAHRGETFTAEDEEDCRSSWQSNLEEERDHPLMTDLDTPPEFW